MAFKRSAVGIFLTETQKLGIILTYQRGFKIGYNINLPTRGLKLSIILTYQRGLEIRKAEVCREMVNGMHGVERCRK